MKKRITAVVLALALCAALCSFAVAQTYEAKPNLSLTFSGTTANCMATITDYGKSISATMQLWQGTIIVGIWSDSGVSSLTLRGTCPVTKGKTYTLKVFGSSDGVPFDLVMTSKTC